MRVNSACIAGSSNNRLAWDNRAHGIRHASIIHLGKKIFFYDAFLIIEIEANDQYKLWMKFLMSMTFYKTRYLPFLHRVILYHDFNFQVSIHWKRTNAKACYSVHKIMYCKDLKAFNRRACMHERSTSKESTNAVWTHNWSVSSSLQIRSISNYCRKISKEKNILVLLEASTLTLDHAPLSATQL